MAEKPKQLRPINPFDLAQLLWWLLMNPKQWALYRQRQGKKYIFNVQEKDIINDEPAGVWLSATLMILPSFIIMLGIALNTLQIKNSDYQWLRYVVFVMPVIWIFIGLKDNYLLHKIGSILFGILFGVMLGILFGTISSLVDAVSGGIILIILLGILFGFAGVIAGGVTGDASTKIPPIALVLIGGLTGVIGGLLAGFYSFFLTILLIGIISGVIGGVLIEFIQKAIKLESPTFMTRFIFITLIASHAFLIWYCLLGGYQVLN